MDRSPVGRPKARTAVAAATLGAVAAAQPAIALLAPDDEPLAALAAAGPSAALALVGAGLLVHLGRRQKTIIRELGRVRMVDRDHADLGAAMLAQMHQIRAIHDTIAAALDENNVRWEKRQAEVYQTGYMDGMQRRGPDDPPALHSV